MDLKPPKCDLVDESKLKIVNGNIHYKLYGQDGVFIPMTVPDTPYYRRFVAWVQIHDRYVTHKTSQ